MSFIPLFAFFIIAFEDLIVTCSPIIYQLIFRLISVISNDTIICLLFLYFFHFFLTFNQLFEFQNFFHDVFKSDIWLLNFLISHVSEFGDFLFVKVLILRLFNGVDECLQLMFHFLFLLNLILLFLEDLFLIGLSDNLRSSEWYINDWLTSEFE